MEFIEDVKDLLVKGLAIASISISYLAITVFFYCVYSVIWEIIS